MLALQEGQLLRSTCVSPAIALVRATPEVCPLGGDVDAEHPVATRCDVLAGLEAFAPARGHSRWRPAATPE